ncbi:MAG: hypothetical protein F9K44_06755, partial [Hyphomicrobiaceae bacterium]
MAEPYGSPSRLSIAKLVCALPSDRTGIGEFLIPPAAHTKELPNRHTRDAMNYRHAYHAGNFADVVKHLILVLV